MGYDNEHKAFKITSIKETKVNLTPSIDMKQGRVIKRHNIFEHHRISFVANQPDKFPEDPEPNEITYKDGGLWIYKKIGDVLQWVSIAGGAGTTVNASNVVEDPSHRFVTDQQINVIQEVADGLIPAPKIVQDPDHQFLNETQVNAVNELIDGVDIDGGDLV